MQVTKTQVARSIEALKRQNGKVATGSRCEPEAMPDELVEVLAALPTIRRERTDDVRTRLADGTLPSADELAEKLIGRLICDRLR